jgi:hypothetical protein
MMRNTLPPLASNDLFGGAHLGQHAERIQPNNYSSVVGSRSIRNHVKPLQRNAERLDQPNTIRPLVEGN